MNGLNTQKNLRVLFFKLCNVRVCINIESIKSVLQIAYLEAVPTAPFYLAGLLNLAGTSVPVYDLALQLGLNRVKPYTIATPMIILEIHNKQLGILVDEIISIYTINQEQIQAETNFDAKTSPFKAIISIDANLSLLINENYLVPKNIMQTEAIDSDSLLAMVQEHEQF